MLRKSRLVRSRTSTFLTVASGTVCRSASSTAWAARRCPAPTEADKTRIFFGILAIIPPDRSLLERSSSEAYLRKKVMQEQGRLNRGKAMKYAIVIPDGCADEPQDSLGGRTPLQAACKPHMDTIAQTGMVGRSNNVPAVLTPASDVATLSLFGYDPLQVYTGRAPLEAAAMGIPLGPDDWAIRCNLVAIENEEMRDFTAGHITSEDGKALIEAIQQRLGGPVDGDRLEFHAGVSYRNILVYRAGN